MKRNILFWIILFFCGVKVHGQVTIGSPTKPDENAILDLKEAADGTATKGLLMPRVALVSTNLPAPLASHVAGMTVYNTAVSEEGEVNYVSPGFYYNDGTKWERLHLGTTNWFYMPSIVFDTSQAATGVKVDLYAKFKAQFLGTNTTTFMKSDGAPPTIPYIPEADKLYYYITYYDSTVFSDISIDKNGLMTYSVNPVATDATHINIIFVVQ